MQSVSLLNTITEIPVSAASTDDYEPTMQSMREPLLITE